VNCPNRSLSKLANQHIWCRYNRWDGGDRPSIHGSNRRPLRYPAHRNGSCRIANRRGVDSRTRRPQIPCLNYLVRPFSNSKRRRYSPKLRPLTCSDFTVDDQISYPATYRQESKPNHSPPAYALPYTRLEKVHAWVEASCAGSCHLQRRKGKQDRKWCPSDQVVGAVSPPYTAKQPVKLRNDPISLAQHIVYLSDLCSGSPPLSIQQAKHSVVHALHASSTGHNSPPLHHAFPSTSTTSSNSSPYHHAYSKPSQ
jgi:hypothetical protein